VRLSRGRAGLDGGSVARESVLGSSKAPPPSLLRPSPNPHAPLSKPPSPSAAPRHNPTPLLPILCLRRLRGGTLAILPEHEPHLTGGGLTAWSPLLVQPAPKEAVPRQGAVHAHVKPQQLTLAQHARGGTPQRAVHTLPPNR
jgi:hypothetical protein